MRASQASHGDGTAPSSRGIDRAVSPTGVEFPSALVVGKGVCAAFDGSWQRELSPRQGCIESHYFQAIAFSRSANRTAALVSCSPVAVARAAVV